MSEYTLPNGRTLLECLTLNPDMLQALPKVPVPARALRALISVLAADLPFDEDFYAATYPDLAAARDDGRIPDLHKHFVELGYLEGRLGAQPQVDEKFYRNMYPDVAAAIAKGTMKSALEHYVRAGAVEGRFASETHMRVCRRWEQILGR
jgi:hypothetical protein